MITHTVYMLIINITLLCSLQAMQHNQQQIVPASTKEQPSSNILLVPTLSNADNAQVNEHSNFLSQLSQEVFEHNIAHQHMTQCYCSRGTQLHQACDDARYLQILNELASKINPQYLSNTEKPLLEKIYEVLSRANFNYLLKLMSDPL